MEPDVGLNKNFQREYECIWIFKEKHVKKIIVESINNGKLCKNYINSALKSETQNETS